MTVFHLCLCHFFLPNKDGQSVRLDVLCSRCYSFFTEPPFMWFLKWWGRPCTLHFLTEWSSAPMQRRWSRDSHQKPFPRVVFIFCSPSRVPKGAVTENSDSSWCHLTGIYISYLPLVIGLVENSTSERDFMMCREKGAVSLSTPCSVSKVGSRTITVHNYFRTDPVSLSVVCL